MSKLDLLKAEATAAAIKAELAKRAYESHQQELVKEASVDETSPLDTLSPLVRARMGLYE